MKMENDFLKNEALPIQEKFLPDNIEINVPAQAENAMAAKNLIEKGFATDAIEAEKFLQKLKEALQLSEEIKKELNGFQDALLMVVSEAEAHLNEIEKDMEGAFADRADVYKEIAEKLSVNFDQMIKSKKQAQNPNKGNFAFRLGRWVSQNQKALVAFSVFAAALRLGGGISHAMDTSYTPIDAPDNDYLLHYDEAGDHNVDHEASENEQVQVDNSENDIGHINKLISHEAAPESPTDQAYNHAQIEQTLAYINEVRLDSSHIVADLANGTSQGNFNLEHLQVELQEKGNVQISVQSYNEVRDGQLRESILSVQHIDGTEQEHGTADNITISAEGSSPENAVMMALNEMNDFAGVYLEGNSKIENSTLQSDTIITAGSNIINIESVEVTHHTIDDGNGNQSTVYEARLTGRGI